MPHVVLLFPFVFTHLASFSHDPRPPPPQAKDKTDDSTYYKLSGGFHRRDFDEDTLDTPLVVELEIDGEEIGNINGDCSEKEGAKGQLRATCKPSPDTP